MEVGQRSLAQDHVQSPVKRRALPVRGSMALLIILVAASYAIALVPLFVELPAPFAVDSNNDVVTSVQPGSYVWVLRVREGQSAEPWPSESGTPGYEIDRGDGSAVGISERFDIVGTDTLGAALLLLVAAVVFARVGLPGVALLLGLSSAAALAPMSPVLGLPESIPLALIPPAVITVALVLTAVSRGRRFLLLGAVVCTAMFTILGLASVFPQFAWPWDLLWKLGGIGVLLIGAVSAAPYLLILVRGHGSFRTRTHELVDAVFPISRSSRLSATAIERDRIASEIHDHLLPSLGQAILEVDADDPAGRERLADLAQHLRDSLSHRQTTVLRRAGLLVALRGYAASLRAPIALVVDGKESSRCSADAEFAAYRVGQLALANAVEHSGADHITVDVDVSNSGIDLKIVDDGVGIDQSAESEALARGHVGLAEMRNAAQAVGAQLSVTGRADEGTTVLFRYRR
jgi:signal transduction histidine kinase